MGQVITYTLVATNTGNVTLTGVGITEASFSGSGTLSAIICPASGTMWPGAVGQLAPNQQVTCSATYTITQADEDAGDLSNTAMAVGTPPAGAKVSDTATVTLPENQQPSISVTKTGVLDTTSGAAKVGTTIAYTAIATNTGNVTLHTVSVTDAKVPNLVCDKTTLRPGQITTCTGWYTLTQADINAGAVQNTAHAHGTPPVTPTNPSPTPVTDTDTIITTVPQAPGISLTKSATPHDADHFGVGQAITYTFVATNTGNVTLTGVSITDTSFSGSGTLSALTCPAAGTTWPGTVGTLTPNQQVRCTATYTITQADEDAGDLTNTGTATGTPPVGVNVSDTSTVTLPANPVPGISVTKTGVLDTTAGPATVGTTIAYTVMATNTGNVTLHNVSVVDTKVSNLVCDATTLWPGQITMCTGTYALTQADINAGSVQNTASAHGTPPATPTDPSPTPVTDTDTITTSVPANPRISLTKSASPNDAAHFNVGQVITYTFVATNTGNVTLSGVTITDTDLPGLSAITCTNWPGAVGTLTPGQQVGCTATYTITQANEDAGDLTNTAMVVGTAPTGVNVTSSDTVTIPDNPMPTITAVKTGVLNSVGPPQRGTTITYTVIATNTGNVTLHNVSVTDAKVANLTCDQTTLWPGQFMTCTGTYTLTQADINAGSVQNTASAQGTPPATPTDPTPVPVTDTDTITTDLSSDARITLTKTANPQDAAHFTVGQVITYTFVAANTGNVTLTGVTITDSGFTGSGTLSAITCPTWPGAAGTLTPSQEVTCRATYTITQDDEDAGVVSNTATVSGKPPVGANVTDTASVTIMGAANPALSLTKSVAPATMSALGPVVYSFQVTNTGNVTLSGISVTDTAFSGTGTLGAITCPVTVLHPGASTTCTAHYTLTQPDLNAGQVTNTATAQGTPPATAANPNPSPVTSAPSNAVVNVDHNPAMTIVKSATPNDPASYTVGQAITYSFVVTNAGNVTLTGVSVTETSFSGTGTLSAITCPSWPGAVGTLTPSQQVVCSATYTLTQDDFDAGSLTNLATASGTPPSGPAISEEGTITLPEIPNPDVALVKTAATVTRADASVAGANPGAVITYTLTATNTGNVTLHDVVISEAMALDNWSCTPAEPATLLPGVVMTCLGTAPAAADAGSDAMTNNAEVSGTPPTGSTVTHQASVVVPIHQPPTATAQTGLIAVISDPLSTTTSVTLDGQPTPAGINGAPINLAATAVGTITATGPLAKPGDLTVTLNADGTITVTAASPGTYTIPVTYTDDNGQTVTVNHVVNVISPDSATTSANKDKTHAGVPVVISVLEYDPLGLTVSSIPAPGAPGYPAHGTLALDAGAGEITYTPDAGYSGPDQFTFTVADALGNQAVATVSIMVHPVASDDSITVPAGSQNNVITVTVNDSGTNLTPTSVPDRGAPGGPSHGTVTIVNGQVLYTADPTFFGTDTFVYTTTDQFGQTTTATVTVTVVPPPIKANDDHSSTKPSTPVTIDVLTNDIGVELTITSATTADGKVSIVNGKLVFTPADGFAGKAIIHYTITDRFGQTSSATVTVDVPPSIPTGGTSIPAANPGVLAGMVLIVLIGLSLAGVLLRRH
ncbi:MAG: Ig-like domain-containing protein [Propionibacteriaceae bacterium]|nr:Ig-like domain-containing protein [Propionibacteriaceae bacterium]